MKRWPLFFATCVAALVSGRTARAEDRAAAQLLFDQGKSLMAEGRLGEACQKFEASAQLSQTPGVRLNLVDCWSAMGRTASAWAMSEEALGLAERSGDGPAAMAASQRRDALQKQLTYLAVTVPPDAALPGLEIARDGQRMLAAEWGMPVPVDPGPHTVSAQAPGRAPWSSTQTLAAPGATVTVAVPVLVETSASEAASPRMHGTRVVGLVTAGVGVVGLAVGAALALDAASQKSTYEAHEGPGGQCADLTCQTASHDAYAAGTWSTVAFLAGGAACAAGAFLWFYAPGASTGVAPAVGPHTAGLAFQGAW
ncbi:MAG TPA: hypothetical protein VGL81_11480 [Polyangiaceae bacterium]